MSSWRSAPPLWIAAARENVESIVTLLGVGVSAENEFIEPILITVMNMPTEDTSMFRVLVESGHPDIMKYITGDGVPPAINNAIDHLFLHNRPTNEDQRRDITAYIEIIVSLLDAGADATMLNRTTDNFDMQGQLHDMTVLDYALVVNVHSDLTKRIISAGGLSADLAVLPAKTTKPIEPTINALAQLPQTPWSGVFQYQMHRQALIRQMPVFSERPLIDFIVGIIRIQHSRHSRGLMWEFPQLPVEMWRAIFENFTYNDFRLASQQLRLTGPDM